MADAAYWTVVHGLKGFLSCFCRVETHQTKEVPAGPWILACNHLSHFDPPLIAGAFRRPLDFLAMRELFRPAWFGFLLRSINVIPVGRRQADTTALKVALQRLKKGRIVCVFPEGGIASRIHFRVGRGGFNGGSGAVGGPGGGAGSAGGSGGKRPALCAAKLGAASPGRDSGGGTDGTPGQKRKTFRLGSATGKGDAEGV